MCPAAQGDTDPPCLPLRGRWQREALAEGEIPHGFLSLSRLRRQPPLPEGASQRGTAALTGRRTPRAFVPLRSTAGRRPLQPLCGHACLSFRRGAMPTSPRRACAVSLWAVRVIRPYAPAPRNKQKKTGGASLFYMQLFVCSYASMPRLVRYFLTIRATLKVMASSNSRRSRPVSFLIFSSR